MVEPKNQILKLAERFSIPEDLTSHAVTPFLNEKSLCALTWTCKSYRNQYKDKLADKKAAADMLHCVLNPTIPNQAQFLELLAKPKHDKNGQPLYLIQNHGEEVYLNKERVKKTKTLRYSTNVLEAILRTKNFHLAKTLFNCIPEQEKTKHLKKYISMIKSQDIWGIPKLQFAYKNFLDSWQTLFDIDELNRLSGSIGRALKEHLPWFSIFLFCHPVTHSNADYTIAPNWTCILLDDSELDLDLLGPDTIYTLYKGLGTSANLVRFGGGKGEGRGYDSQAFANQSKVLSTEMDKIIIQYGLDAPESELCREASHLSFSGRREPIHGGLAAASMLPIPSKDKSSASPPRPS